MQPFFWIVCLGYVVSIFSDEIDNGLPIVGIVVQETSPTIKKEYPDFSTYIAASYVKAVEAAGARVAPVLLDQPESYYRDLFLKINGILLPGGYAAHGLGHPYYDTVRKIYDVVVEINDDGIKLPIFAVCLGMEFLLEVANNDRNNIIKVCNIFDEYYPLNFLVEPSSSVMYSKLDTNQKYALTTEDMTFNWHIWCVDFDEFEKNSSLPKEWVVTTTSKSQEKNYTFIASVENKKYPFYGVQFHPEKISYEWTTAMHTPDRIEINRYFYDFFVDQTRLNKQRFKDKNEEHAKLIYNCPVTYTARKLTFMQVYFDPFIGDRCSQHQKQ